jgi:NADH dehydrogenase
LLTFVLIGGGATGVELAGAMSELARGTLVRDFRHIDPSQARIVLAEAGSKLLAGYPDALPEYARHSLQRMGVEVHLNTEIKAIDDRGVTTKRGRIDAATVLWCAGVKATPVAYWLGCGADKHGRIPVAPDLSLADHPEIFVIGDAAVVHGADGKPLPGLAAVAKQQGGYVARALVDRLAGRTAAPFRYRDRGTLAVIGRHSGVANLPHFKSTGVLAWLLWAIVHLYFLIGGRNRLAVFLNWAWAWLTYQRGSRLILSGGSAEPSNTDSPRKPEEFAHGQHD